MSLEKVTNHASKKLEYSVFLLHEFNKRRQLYNHVRVDMTLANDTISCGIFHVSDDAKFSEGSRRLIWRHCIDIEDSFSKIADAIMPALRLKFLDNDIFINKIMSLTYDFYRIICELHKDMRILDSL